ncbi:uncharacterized protein N7483_010617 [Penicillium malachiteum]|uniref:uncharacterized protein n=1 Tax=Penicillium malachiteum TaxID=1324776 RepID=UPI002547BEC9|nr:uncharacterized protein N7483_010617 [Penicillium malachiteum]KAJ5713436.1 hypothetical protein N7483_010617 [Penicillium malachiteum]
MTTTDNSYTLTLVGDVMLARQVDQLLPTSIDSPRDARNVSDLKSKHPSTLNENAYTPSAPWGTTLPLLRSTDLFLINLETSVTTTNQAWPNKTYNYRMHPANLGPVLHAAHVDYASLANNHVLDYSEEGLVETVWTLKETGISFAGAGETTDEAYKPAVLWVPRSVQEFHSRRVDGKVVLPSQHRSESGENNGFRVHVYSASDHPLDWASVPTFHFLDYSESTRERLRRLCVGSGIQNDSSESDTRPALKIFSVHWGPNYTWSPSDQIRSLAHFLIDECDVDIVYGHSSHHIQGAEVYHGRVILYGCGDFVNDYVFRETYRNDLGAVWRVIVREAEKDRLMLDRLEIFPTRLEQFRACLLGIDAKDHAWVREKIQELSLELGTVAREELGQDGQVIIDINA